MKRIFKQSLFLLGLFLIASLGTLPPTKAAWNPTAICQRVGEKIDWHLTRYTEHKDKFVERVNEAIAKLKEINQKLKAKGCDTAKLEADYQSLGTQLQAWVNDYNTFINLLNEAKTLACGQSEGAYKEKVKQARLQIRTVREKGVGIINYYNQTIKPDIEVLKSSCSLFIPTKAEIKE